MGFLRRVVDNPVAANMLMVLIMGGGLVASFKIPREVFPEFSANFITISVAYPGASPADVEQGICWKIEDRLTGLEGIKEISSISREGAGVVSLELQTGADVRKVLDDVKSEVDAIDLPIDAEDPVIKELTVKRHVIHVAVVGDAPERTLKEIAEDIRDEINALDEVSQVSVAGVRDYEISVEVSEESLRRLGLTLAKVASAIRQGSLDLPAGTVKTRSGEMTIRVVGQRYTAEEFKGLVILSRADGTVVRLGDIADVRETFEDVDLRGRFNGKPAVLVSVFKTPREDSIAISEAVKAYVARKSKQLPEGITLHTWSDISQNVRSRLRLLTRNGLQGLVLVFLVLWLFLRLRLSVWVAMGIPVSILGTILVMYMTGTTLNMMSMFALIMALGLIVDDAIVVGENVFARLERGAEPKLAAVEGTRAVLLPVVGAVVTTWLAFLPLLFLPGIMGRFIQILPVCVIVALALSLLECVAILPAHLGHSLRPRAADEAGGHADRPAPGLRRRIDAAIAGFINGPFARAYRLAVRYRYVTVAVFVGIMCVMAGAFVGGHIRAVLFPRNDSDTLRATLVMPTGTPFWKTDRLATEITQAALDLNKRFAGASGQPVVRNVYTLVGQQTPMPGVVPGVGSHLANVMVELLPAEQRTAGLTSTLITRHWRRNALAAGGMDEALQLTFESFRGGPGGKALEIRLLGQSTESLKPVAAQLEDRLRRFEGVSDVQDDALPGKLEMKIRLRAGAENLGIRLRQLADQLRDAFYGNESLKLQRGRDEIKVMVRYPSWQRQSLEAVENMRVRTAAGAEVPFHEVAEVTIERGYTTLRRVGNKSVVTVSADVDEQVANAEQILQQLQRRGGFFDHLRSAHPGLSIDLRGQRRQFAESLESLKVSYLLALLGIYSVLAVVFRSYLQPVIIMLAIPFGLVGAVVGHWLLGFDVTLLSLFGMVALTGIVVNDSLVLIDYVNRQIRSGRPVLAALEAGALRRFRPIILTTVTTVVGMTPILLERSFQAQFLKPMVVSIAFGLAFATMLTLLVVPSLYLIGNDLRRVLRWLRSGRWPSAEEVAAGGAEAGGEEAPAL